MAVQAHYQSSTLLLHNRTLQPQDANHQIAKDHSFQPQQARIDSRVLDHQIVGEDDVNRVIELTKLRSRNDGVNTGLRLAFPDQQWRRSVSDRSLMTEELSNQIKRERDEIEYFLRIQGEEIRRTLAEKRHVHCRALLEAAERSAARMLQAKDAEAEKAAWRRAELEARAAQLSLEAEAWAARAAAQEAEAARLQMQLQCAGVEAEATGYNTADAESAWVDPERVEMVSRPGCKVCLERVASVVLLPCRHLCVCSECDGVVLACPLCLSLRSSSIEVYMWAH